MGENTVKFTTINRQPLVDIIPAGMTVNLEAVKRTSDGKTFHWLRVGSRSFYVSEKAFAYMNDTKIPAAEVLVNLEIAECQIEGTDTWTPIVYKKGSTGTVVRSFSL